jgi:hypothetical protein
MGSVSKRTSRRGIKKVVRTTTKHFNNAMDNPRIIITTNAAVIYNNREAKETVLETMGNQTIPVVKVAGQKVKDKIYTHNQEPEVHLHISEEKSPPRNEQRSSVLHPITKVASDIEHSKMAKSKY